MSTILKRKTAFHSKENYIFNIKQIYLILSKKYNNVLKVKTSGTLNKLQKIFHNRFTNNVDLMISCHELYLSCIASLK